MSFIAPPPRHSHRGLIRAAQRVALGVVVVASALLGGGVAIARLSNDGDQPDVAQGASDHSGGKRSEGDVVVPGATASPDVAAGAGDAAPVNPQGAVDPATQLTADDITAGILTTDVPSSASGNFVVASGTVAASEADAVMTVRVEVEDGLPVNPDVFAARVMTILNDPRGWGAGGRLSFARTDGDADIRVTLASAATVDSLCAPVKTESLYSCGRNSRASINYARWAHATPEFGDDLATYRAYVINHEVGHLLGHAHEKCPAAGAVAPIMQQQTMGVAPCLPNGWPHPDGE